MSKLINSLKPSKKTVLRGLLIWIVCLLGALCFTHFFIGSMLYKKYQVFLSSAEVSHQEVLTLIKDVHSQQHETSAKTFLILGIDELENRPGFPQLTDTMILTKIDPQSATVTSLSLPRDLWHEPYKTKINALYEYGKERYPNQPQKFPKEVLSEMTGIEINTSIVISLNQLGEIIDLLGGVMIDVKRGFTDHKFPRTDVDILIERDPAKLYETITFEEGLQLMDGETALKYIRSRNSEDPQTGSDLARADRQQQVISSLVSTLTNKTFFWSYPEVIGQLFKYYQDNFSQYLSIKDLLVLGYNLMGNMDQLKLETVSLPIYPNNQDSFIKHPQNLSPYQQQWVYIITDEADFLHYFQTNF